MNTFALWVAIEIACACHGTEGWARITVSPGWSAATSSSSNGSEKRSLMPRPPGRPAPMPFWPVWNSAGTPSSSSAAHSAVNRSSLGANACTLGWNLKPSTPWSSTSERACSTAASPRHGSTDPNGMSTSAWSAQRAAMSSLEIGSRPRLVRASTVNTTAAMPARR